MIEVRPDAASLRVARRLIFSLFALACLGTSQYAASQASKNPATKSTAQPSATSSTTMPRMRGTTMAQRKAAAAHSAVNRSKTVHLPARRPLATTIVRSPLNTGLRANATLAASAIQGAAGPVATPGELYFSGVYPNYANSPLPNPNDTVNCSSPNWCGIRKFVDTLPLPNTANDLGQMIPVAVPDTTTFPGSDYYEISLVQYTEQLHADLPATMLRGYVQTNGPLGLAQKPYYLGPLIIAHSNRPVRVKFTNSLGSVTDTNFATTGKLFVPEDNTVMGAGLGLAKGASQYLDNRATIHLHGGNTPWISDGTPHQWTVPAVDAANTLYPRGDSAQFVPDMFFLNGTVVPQCGGTVTTNCSDPTSTNNATTLPAGATNDPGPGALTFYYTNQQSARLMFYHDHAYGTTRLNVYTGEAAGYLLTDSVEDDLVNGTDTTGVFTKAGLTPSPVIPSAEIPLIIQDKTFVPPNPASTSVYSVPMLENGDSYTSAAVSFAGGCTVEPTATANVGTMTDPFGQFIYGAVTDITLTSAGSGCTSDPVVTITGDGSGAVAFASIATLSQQDPTWDSTNWGGVGNLWYPHVYMPNQWPGNPDLSAVNPMGRWDYASWFWPSFTNQYQVRGEIPCDPAYPTGDSCPGFPSALNPAPLTDLAGGVHLGQGSTASLTPEAFMDTPMVNGTVYPTLTVDPKPYRFRVLSAGNDRTLNLSFFLACGLGSFTPTPGAVCPTPTVAGIVPGTEVAMVPAAPTAGFPAWWPTDGRDGGVPDPKSMGPSWIAIGNEGGFLPAPAVIPPAPTNYEYDRRSVTVTNTSSVSLELMPAERADVIVDFSAYACKTLILYNDSPAPNPAFDSRYDYYTGDPDQTGTGGAPSTLAGFGPNTRTIMQVKVNCGTSSPYTNLSTLQTALPAAFAISQPVPVVPEPVYSKAYGTKFTAHYPTLNANTMTFTPIGGTTPITITFGQKAIQELFELDYGRMNATLGTEIQFTNFNNQTTIPLGYVDPFTEDIYDSANVAGRPVGVTGDGSQIWEVIHNGVDSHAIHFHLFNVELLDRVGWDGTVRAPLPIEQGWKDTVRMNPLEIDFVALRPMSQTLPFPVPDSVRLLDVTRPVGKDPAMSGFGPTNQAFSQDNQVVPMGWEYVWHCHILGHEENDMMREAVFQVPPQTPNPLAAVASAEGTVLTFTDMSLSETGFTVQRSTDPTFASGTGTLFFAPAQAGWNLPVTWTDSSPTSSTVYSYRVQSYKPDADYWNTPLTGTTLPNLVSAWSNIATANHVPILLVTPASLAFGSQIYRSTSGSQTVTIKNDGAPGAGPLAISSIGITSTDATGVPPDFAISASTCGATLAPAATCTVSVRFTPTIVGARTGQLTIVSNAPANASVSVPLTGTGTPAPLTITASSTSLIIGSPVPTITPTVAGLLAPDTIASLGTILCSTTYTTTSGVGTYPTTCSGAVNTNYTISYVAGSVTARVPAPTLSSISPISGVRGTSVPVTLTGTNLTGATAVAVSGTGVTVSGLTVVNATTATATFTIAGTATVSARTVTITTPGGTSNTVTFTVTSPGAPTLTSIAPTSGAQGATVPITLTGTNLTGATAITVSGTGVTVSGLTVVGPTSVTATFAVSGTATLSARTVSITTPGGTSNTVTFTVVSAPVPTLTSITPNTGVSGTTVPVTLTGTNLTGATRVTASGYGITVSGLSVVNSTTASVNLVLATYATAGAGNVSITTPGGTSNTVTFTVLRPTITSVVPSTLVRGTTGTLTVTGTNLGGATGLSINPTGVTISNFVLTGTTTITATYTVPIGTTGGTRSINVTGTGGASNSLNISVVAPPAPTLTTIAPTTGLHGTSVTVTLTGTNLTGASSVTVSGTGVTVSGLSVTSPTSATATFTISSTAALTARTVSITTPGGTSNTRTFTVQ